MRHDGIRDLQGILDRCKVDDITGCWLWGGGTSKGCPRACICAGVLHPERRSFAVRRAAWVLSGRPDPGDRSVYRKHDCPNSRCVNPAHCHAGLIGSQASEIAKRKDSPLRDARRIATLHRIRNKLAEQVAQAILGDLSAGMLQKHAAKKHGVNKGTVSLIARGMHHSQRQNLMRGASVFAQGSRACVSEAA
jgi:predicted XRE-type DNA-binding protein